MLKKRHQNNLILNAIWPSALHDEIGSIKVNSRKKLWWAQTCVKGPTICLNRKNSHGDGQAVYRASTTNPAGFPSLSRVSSEQRLWWISTKIHPGSCSITLLLSSFSHRLSLSLSLIHLAHLRERPHMAVDGHKSVWSTRVSDVHSLFYTNIFFSLLYCNESKILRL